MVRVFPHRVMIALLMPISLLGAAPATVSSMYLRIASMQAAPHVTNLSYDAVATVPGRPHTPAKLLAPNRVEGAMIVPFDTANVRLETSSFKGVSTFTVVAVDGEGTVVQRTSFDGVTIRSVSSVGAGDGTMARRIEFGAASVTVSGPKAT